MADEKEKASGLAGAIAALERLAETPNESRMSVKDRLAEPALYDAVQKAKRAKRTNAEIAAALTAEGIKVSAGTLAQYLRKIEAEKMGGTDGKRGRKKTEAKIDGTGGAKGTLPTNPENGAGTKSEKESGSGPNDGGTKTATGKHLTQKPGMGGAFGTDDL